MKKSLIITGLLLLAGLFIVSNRTTGQQGPVRGTGEAVIMHLTEDGPPYRGVFIYNSSSSDGAPKFPNYPQPMVQAAQAVAELTRLGYDVRYVGEYGTRIMAIKRP